MQFFFDIIEGSNTTEDWKGCDFESPEAARQQVLRVLPEVLLADLKDTDDREIGCSVRDEHGSVLYRASVTLKGQRSPNP